MYRIFDIAPAAQDLFRFYDGFAEVLEDKVYEEMFQNKSFILHRRLVIEMVDTAIGLLENGDLETLIGVLKDMGRRHVKYGVLPPHYSVVGEALIHTLGAALGDKFTPSLRGAWLDVWGVISAAMIEGAESGI
jgi:hemoglobin-like flavoprotein